LRLTLKTRVPTAIVLAAHAIDTAAVVITGEGLHPRHAAICARCAKLDLFAGAARLTCTASVATGGVIARLANTI